MSLNFRVLVRTGSKKHEDYCGQSGKHSKLVRNKHNLIQTTPNHINVMQCNTTTDSGDKNRGAQHPKTYFPPVAEIEIYPDHDF